MNHLIRAELSKIIATRSCWWLAGVAVLVCAGWTVMSVLLFDPNLAAAGVPDGPRLVTIYQSAQMGYAFALLIGVVVMTGEYRHQTITWTFLVSPVRERVLVAKAVSQAIVGVVVGLAGAVATTATAMILLVGQSRPLMTGEVPALLLGCVFTTAAYAVLGVALGALVRNQVAAVAIAFGVLFYAESIVAWLLPAVARWSPNGAAKAMIGWQQPGTDPLPIWAGAAVFVGYIVVTGVSARLVTLRRDVT